MVLAIIAILAAVLVPTLSQYLPSVQLSGSTRTLTGDLREAQEKAITEQDQYLIYFVQLKNPPIYHMIKIKKDPVTQLPVREQIREETLPGSIELTLEPTPADDQIAFSSDGGPSAPLKVTLTLKGNGSQKKIDISPAGFIKIE